MKYARPLVDMSNGMDQRLQDFHVKHATCQLLSTGVYNIFTATFPISHNWLVCGWSGATVMEFHWKGTQQSKDLLADQNVFLQIGICTCPYWKSICPNWIMYLFVMEFHWNRPQSKDLPDVTFVFGVGISIIKKPTYTWPHKLQEQLEDRMVNLV